MAAAAFSTPAKTTKTLLALMATTATAFFFFFFSLQTEAAVAEPGCKDSLPCLHVE